MNVKCLRLSKNNQQSTIKVSKNCKLVARNQVINRKAMLRHLDLNLSGDGTRTRSGKRNLLRNKAPNELKASLKRASSFNIGATEIKTTNIIPFVVYSEPVLKGPKIIYYKENGRKSGQISELTAEKSNMSFRLTSDIRKSKDPIECKRFTCYGEKNIFKYRACFIGHSPKGDYI